MTATYAVRNVALPSSGSLDVTISGFGAVSGVTGVTGNAYSGANPTTQFSYSIGFFDGTTQRCNSVRSVDNQSSVSVTRRRSHTNRFLTFLAADGTTVLEYSISSITDGVRITLSSGTTGVNRVATIMLFGGTSDCHVGSIDANTTQDATTESVSLGHSPDLILFSTSGLTSAITSATANILSFGCCDSSLNQYAVAVYDEDNAATTGSDSTHWNNRVGGQLTNGTSDWDAEVTAIGADTFTITTRTGVSGGDELFFMSVNLDGDDAKVVQLSTKTTTGSQATTGFGFEPDAVLFGFGIAASSGGTANGAAIGIGASDGTTSGSVSAFSTDNVSTTQCDSRYSDTTPVLLTTANGAKFVEAAFTSFDADGITLNYTTANATARFGFAVAMGPSAGGSVIQTRRRRDLGGYGL